MSCECKSCSKKRNDDSEKAFKEWIAGKRDISIRHWDWECGDGCCSDYGTDVYVNDFKLVHADGSNTESTLDAMLDFLGYDNVQIEETYDYDDYDDED